MDVQSGHIIAIKKQRKKSQMGQQHCRNIKGHTRLETIRTGGVEGSKIMKGRKARVPNGGSCKQTISGGALTKAKELNKERNTFQLPRVLC